MREKTRTGKPYSDFSTGKKQSVFLSIFLLLLSVTLFAFDVSGSVLKSAFADAANENFSENPSLIYGYDYDYDFSRETVITLDLRNFAAGSYYIPRQNFTGNYLAGRYAQNNQDWSRAADFMAQAVELSSTPQRLRDNAFVLLVGAGEINRAHKLAQNLSQHEDEKLSADIQPLADIINILKQLQAVEIGTKDGQATLRAIEKQAENIPAEGLHLYSRAAISGWISVFTKDESGVYKALDMLPRLADGSPSVIYHLYAANMFERMGDTERAANHYYHLLEDSAPVHAAFNIARFFSTIGDEDTASILHNALAESGIEMQLAPNLQNQTITALIATSFFDLTSYLYDQKAYESALIFSQITKSFVPDLYDTDLMLGDLMSVYGSYDAALSYYQRVPKHHPAYINARIRLAESYEKNNMMQQALSILKDIENYKKSQSLLVRIGDIYRREGQFENSINYYSAALDLIEAHGSDQDIEVWRLYYARAISHDQNGAWAYAEKDLLAAKDLNPQNPLILNYLGYSWVDRNQNLHSSLEMLEQALAYRPYDGFVLDSVGWALFKLGRYEEAVSKLEQAVQLLPNDPVIHDHLGDVYWAVGRINEARFAWSKALQSTDDDKRISAIQVKIKTGLNLVETVLQTADIQKAQ